MNAYVVQILDALGDPTRRSVFTRLRFGARSVGDIAEGMGVSRAAVSQRLKVLKAARLVTERAAGTRLDAVDTRSIEISCKWLHGLWGELLTAVHKKQQKGGCHDGSVDRRI